MLPAPLLRTSLLSTTSRGAVLAALGRSAASAGPGATLVLHTSNTRRCYSHASSSRSTDATSSKPSLKGKLLPASEVRDAPEPGWALPHTTYTEEELNAVRVVRKEVKGASDRFAHALCTILRTGFDIATRYPSHKHNFPEASEQSKSNVVPVDAGQQGDASKESAVKPKKSTIEAAKRGEVPDHMELSEMRRKGLSFGPDQWLIRIVFLETVAGVPGMVAGMVRHLESLRLLRRDGAWIHTMLEDAMNERQHLLVALKLYNPGWFMRGVIMCGQAIFTAGFSALYLVAPSVAHKFVGYLEEEAVVTYSNILRDIQAGRLPEWENFDAPSIAIDYWGLRPDAKLPDVMRALRADEANHRYINHTLGNLKRTDFNPFAYGDAPAIQRGQEWGMTRDEALAYFEREDSKRRLAMQEQRKARADAGKQIEHVAREQRA